MTTPQQIQQHIVQSGFLPLFSTDDETTAQRALKAAYSAGLRAFEFTNRTDGALQLFKNLMLFAQREMPDLLLGIGTIKNAQQANDFAKAGAHFLISPIILPEIFEAAQQHQLLWIPGCATATEIGLAENWGLSLVKVFPAKQLGGPAYFGAMKAVFPKMQFLATGGVSPDAEDLQSWFRGGVDAVGIGSQLFPKDLLHDEAALHGHLKKIVDAVNAAKRKQ